MDVAAKGKDQGREAVFERLKRYGQFLLRRDQPLGFCDPSEITITDTFYLFRAGNTFRMGSIKIEFVAYFVDICAFLFMARTQSG